ncbi:MAG: hypothetical protein WBA23_09765, partial [Tunicatimonas sp.]|uniref:hypothetical protein n=1 Tax=Tunicatimonas sp. TaxID=1940096 RepID=UPI003C77E640
MNSPNQFNAITGLSPKEFMDLLYHFAPIVEEYYRHHDMKGHRRKVVRYQERSDSSLSGSVEKLIFILTYMNRTADAGEPQPGISWINVLYEPRKSVPLRVSLWV